MVTKKRDPATTSSTNRKASTSRGGTTRRRRTTRTYTRRRRARLPTTLGAALGTLVVATLLEASWPVRIGLVAAVVVLGLAYVVWKNRSEIASSASPDSTASDPPVHGGAGPAAVPPIATDSTVNQGDSTHE